MNATNGVVNRTRPELEVVRTLSAAEMAILRGHAERLQRLTTALTEAKAAAREAEQLVTHCDPALALDLSRGCVVRNAVSDG